MFLLEALVFIQVPVQILIVLCSNFTNFARRDTLVYNKISHQRINEDTHVTLALLKLLIPVCSSSSLTSVKEISDYMTKDHINAATR